MQEHQEFSWIVEPPRPAQYSDSVLLEPQIIEILKERGITKLYSHQAKAIEAIRKGKNIVLMAPTAAGKTECYMIPVVEAALQNKCSLLIFPTKALSRDQWNRIREFSILGVRSAVYDGDIVESQRQKIRSDFPHVIITNFDMLHFMLLYPRIWSLFFSRLKYIVIDEMHAYSGTLGSHVSNVIWRLRRVLNKISIKSGSEISPQFICSSATVGNPLEFASKLTWLGPKELVLIKGDGSPRGKVHHAIASAQDESVVSKALFIAKSMGKKALIFGNSHNMVERLGFVARKMGIQLAVYRSGLPASERRELEASFHSGRIRMLAATSALELGMDVGDADMIILAGFPGTITRLRQRIGRVGRKGQDAYAIFVARDNPLDQYYASNPNAYLLGLPESCYAKPDNPYIRKLHILAAAKDGGLEEPDLLPDDAALVQDLISQGLLKKFGNFLIATKEGAKKVRTLSLRNAGNRVRIIDAKNGNLLGEREQSMAIGELYKGAVYLIGGKRYLSLGIDLGEGIAKLVPIEDEDSIYTQPLRAKHAQILGIDGEGRWGAVKLAYGPVHIVDEVYGFVRKDAFSGNTLSRHELDEPIFYEFDTHALWSDWSEWMDGSISFAEGLHALEHVSIAMMPALSGADPAEIGGISNPDGRIFYYEGAAGGSGLSEIVFERFGECISMAEERLLTCKCKAGCPSCIFSPQCGNNNNYLDKQEALSLAKKALDRANSK
jgi:DEAD/DEAH box helicase domain-containing protein